jgi:hypothetical protein
LEPDLAFWWEKKVKGPVFFRFVVSILDYMRKVPKFELIIEQFSEVVSRI